MHAMEAGLLTYGSSYLPTPSQRMARQWLVLSVFVPVHSGASVRELHPLPAMSTYIAIRSFSAPHVPFYVVDVKQIFFVEAAISRP
jgi:hypothetical protein